MGIKLINCPICNKRIRLKFILEKQGMSRLYAYCKDCKCSIMKSVKRGEEKETSSLFI